MRCVLHCHAVPVHLSRAAAYVDSSVLLSFSGQDWPRAPALLYLQGRAAVVIRVKM